MTFSSLQFLVFFMVITLWFFMLKTQRARIWLLLIGSCYFYMSFIPVYILILASIIVIDFFAGIQIGKQEGFQRKLWLIVSLLANVGTLAFFKYCDFFIDTINHISFFPHGRLPVQLLNIALPLGLSFHTFQAMSYTIEVYRGNQKPERNFAVYALYVMYFPQLVAGPIERPQNILHQLRTFIPYNRDNVKEGISRMLWGFFKKCVIADRFSMVVDTVFAHSGSSSYATLAIGAVFYAFQIYCDFSGYTDIALGAARILGIKLMINFDRPFASRSISEFWRKWHISLYSWFYDYVFNPIVTALRNWGKSAIIFGILFIFLLSGFWHGAGWKWIMYGLMNGVAIVYEYLTKKQRKKIFSRLPVLLNSIISNIITFAFITFSWIFFRAQDVGSAFKYIGRILKLQKGSDDIGINVSEFVFSICLIIILLVREKYVPGFLIKNNKLHYVYVTMMIMVCYFFGVFIENQFIYFQF